MRNGQQAIEYFAGAGTYADRRQHPLPLLVLLDLKLPVRSGLEVLEWIRAQPAFRVVVIIVFSASSHPRDIQRAYELGANCFVTKPQKYSELVELARHLKAWWLEDVQLASIG